MGNGLDGWPAVHYADAIIIVWTRTQKGAFFFFFLVVVLWPCFTTRRHTQWERRTSRLGGASHKNLGDSLKMATSF
jgi:hypothetical protein